MVGGTQSPLHGGRWVSGIGKDQGPVHKIDKSHVRALQAKAGGPWF